MNWKIVADSGCDFKNLEHIAESGSYERVPLTIQVGDEIFVDSIDLDIDQMMDKMYATSTASKSACPSPDDYLNAYQGAENLFVVTITGTLSGSHNSAQVAKQLYLEGNPTARVHVIDSLSAGGEVDLIVEKLAELLNQDLDFDQVVDQITAYQKRTKLAFALSKVDNLVKNGRLSKLLGTVVGLLNIRMVGEASPEGTLELLQKARGHKKSVKATYEEMKKAGYAGGKVLIAHRHNDKFCQELEEFIKADYAQASVRAIPTSGLCSFYAEENGLLLGYEI